jgi:hypothetical protein
MMSVDLDEVTSKYIRGRLEEDLDMDLVEFKPFIDQEMLTILGQMDAPTEIFDHVYLGSEWNASNLEELQKNGCVHYFHISLSLFLHGGNGKNKKRMHRLCISILFIYRFIGLRSKYSYQIISFSLLVKNK